MPAEQLVQDDAEREDIGAPVERLAAELLGRHVRDLALERSGAGRARAVGRFGDAEVDHLRGAVAVDEDVVGRDVAVDQAERLSVAVAQIVRVLQTGRGLRDDLQDLREREQLVQLGRALGDAAQVRAVDELHRDEVVPVRLAQIENRDDVRMVELRSEPRFVQEHVDELLVARQVREDPLEADLLLEARGACLPGEVDLRHSAGGDQLDELVLPERCGHRARGG